MSGGGGAAPRKAQTLDDLVEALYKRERAPSNVPKVDTFHFKGERVSDWLDLTEQALVGLSDEVKFQRILKYVLHSHHREVSKVVDDANGIWARFRDLMRRKYRLGDGLLTMADLEAMNKDDFSIIGVFVHEFKKKARKVHGISEEAQCAIFLGLLTGTKASELTSHGGGSEKLTWATIDKGVEEGSLDQVEQHQMRLQRRKRKERNATLSGTSGVKRIVTDVLAALGYDNEAEVQKRGVTGAPGRTSGAVDEETGREDYDGEETGSHVLTKAQRKQRNLLLGGQGSGKGQAPQAIAAPPPAATTKPALAGPSHMGPPPVCGHWMPHCQLVPWPSCSHCTSCGGNQAHAGQMVPYSGPPASGGPPSYPATPVFCGTASNVMVEIGKVRAWACLFVMPNVDHPILQGRSFLCRTETLVFNRHDGTMILALSDPACGNYEIIKCRNTGPGRGRNRPNLGSFIFEESEYERRRLREGPEEEGTAEVLSLSITDVNKAMEVVAAHDMADPEAIKALREQVLESSQRDAARQRSRETGQADERVYKLREAGDLGFFATRMAIERVDGRIREVVVTSFRRNSQLSDELAARILGVEHLTTQLAEERATSQAREIEWERRFGELAAIVNRLSAAGVVEQTVRAGVDVQDRGTRVSPGQGATVEPPQQRRPTEEASRDPIGMEAIQRVEEETVGVGASIEVAMQPRVSPSHEACAEGLVQGPPYPLAEGGGAQESLMAMSDEKRGLCLHELAAAMGIGTPQERPQRLDTPEYAPRLGELRAELESWATRIDSGGHSSEQQQQEVMSGPAAAVVPQPPGSCRDEVMAVVERPCEGGPQRLDTPEYRPQSIVARGAEAVEPRSQGHMGLPLCHEVTTETMGTPSASSSRGRKKKTARWFDTSLFWCKEGHRALDCPELLEDKAEGRVAEVNGRFYDRQGRIVERAPDVGRAQLYRQNQEELHE
ncbi:hypothetical protein CBR_g21868 [Chara braunii]|uniref:Uncharacterized protein n=1 Tax=Chara braunii TaxID=69332 RepID=A0A388L1E8_CHABU|nr:hypothetical protein CBR_g21868 [Chara braunii]|eukprot:GBG76119.1 hypothetical protein CBR_g21868 [Chara braunii]